MMFEKVSICLLFISLLSFSISNYCQFKLKEDEFEEINNRLKEQKQNIEHSFKDLFLDLKDLKERTDTILHALGGRNNEIGTSREIKEGKGE